MLSISPSANYQLRLGTIFDEEVSVWALVKYIFKVMCAFLIVNALLTLPVVLLVIAAMARLRGGQQ